jgi:hypothetical protein
MSDIDDVIAVKKILHLDVFKKINLALAKIVYANYWVKHLGGSSYEAKEKANTDVVCGFQFQDQVLIQVTPYTDEDSEVYILTYTKNKKLQAKCLHKKGKRFFVYSDTVETQFKEEVSIPIR